MPGDAISLVNGTASTVYTMAQFQTDAGIRVSWPMAQATLLKVTLAEVGNYTIPVGQKLTAAVAISETSPTGKGEVQGYIDGVTVTRTAGGLEISVPASAGALVYGVSGDGKKKAVIDFANSVSGISNTLTSLAGFTNSIVLGSVVNYAVNKIGQDFTGIGALRGRYKVTIVIDGVPLRKADGSALPMLTVNVPTAINSSGAVVAVRPVTGMGLIGFITLSD